jgi:hypothetical protein
MGRMEVVVPNSTPEQEASALRAHGQRQINKLWELTQAAIAVSICLVVLYCCANLILSQKGDAGAFLLLSNVFFLVVGTYFQRTNHTKASGGNDPR